MKFISAVLIGLLNVGATTPTPQPAKEFALPTNDSPAVIQTSVDYTTAFSITIALDGKESHYNGATFDTWQPIALPFDIACARRVAKDQPIYTITIACNSAGQDIGMYVECYKTRQDIETNKTIVVHKLPDGKRVMMNVSIACATVEKESSTSVISL